MIRLKGCKNIPVIDEVELLVVGGGLAGVVIAKEYASKGKKVMLIEKGTFLGHELGQWQRPWIKIKEEYKDMIENWFPISEVDSKLNTVQPVSMDKYKIKMEDVLINERVTILYASIPVACSFNENIWNVVIANKSGRQMIKASNVIDVTPTSIIARLVEKKNYNFYPVDKAYSFYNEEDKEVVTRTIEFVGIDGEFSTDESMNENSYDLPDALGVWGNKVKVYPGGFAKDHVYVEIPVLVDKKRCTLMQDTQIEYKVRKISLEVAAWLGHNAHPFLLAKIGLGSLEVMRGINLEPIRLMVQGEEIAKMLLEDSIDNSKCIVLGFNEIIEHIKPLQHENETCDEISYGENTEFNNLYKIPEVEAKISTLPILEECDVLVVGGGTSGAVSARVAAQEGVSTTLLEMNTALGGTGTLGGVHYYWFGFRKGFTKEINKRIDEWSDQLLYPKQKYYWGMNDCWSIEIKAFVLLEMCMEQGVTVFFNCLNMGTLLNDKKVVGVAVATPYGPYAVKGKVTVDATGDGDIAALAGGEFIYGNERDRMAMWSSFSQFRSPAQFKGSFATTMDVGNVFDFTRFILAGRRRREENFHDHATYAAPRESRHIRGEIILNLTDQMRMKKYPDTIAICFSNHDPKGRSTSDIVYFGILPAHLQIEVPYRAMVPIELEQLLITGKALSCTHDALPAIRMQDDMQNQGGAIGYAAAQCVKENVSPRKLDVKKIQAKLIEVGSIPESVLKYVENEKTNYPQIIENLTGEEPFEWLEMSIFEKAETVSPLVQICSANKEEVIDLLREKFKASEGNLKVLLSRLLLWHKDEMGLDTILSELKSRMEEVEYIPLRKGSVRWCHNYPDHGVMSEVSNLVNTISRVPSKKSIPILELIAERICMVDRDYSDVRQCMFNYIESISYCCERLGYEELLPMLDKLIELPELQNRVRRDEVEIDIMGERLAYLVICLARAMARCGSKKGLLKLAEFVEDNRVLLARSAIDELIVLTGFDFGANALTWKEEINNITEEIQPLPWNLVMD